MADSLPQLNKLAEERQKLLNEIRTEFQATKPSLYDRLQAFTRGYLVPLFVMAILGVLLAILFFPTKAWYRVMLCFVDCVVIPGKKFDFKICNQDHPNPGFDF